MGLALAHLRIFATAAAARLTAPIEYCERFAISIVCAEMSAFYPSIARAVTALAGGYLLASLLSALLARLLPMAPVEATGLALVLSFGLYAAILLWVYAERRLGRALAIVWGGSLIAAGLLLATGWRP